MKCYKTTLKTLMSVPIVAAMCFSASATLANSYPADVKLVNTMETNIYVKSNGTNYTGIATNKHPVGILLKAHVSAYAPEDRRINSWKAGLALQKYGHSYVPNLENSIDSQSGVYGESYAHKKKRKRPRYVQKDISLTISANKLNAFGSQVCNAHADNLRQQGMSNADVFKQDRSVKIHSLTTAKSVTVSYKELGSNFVGAGDYDVADINVVCMKAPVQLDTPSELQTSSGVTDASLNIIEQSTLGGSCKVNLSTVIKTNLPNTKVRYRFEHTNGNKSDIKTVTTSHSKTAMDAHWYDVPLNPNGSEAGSVRIVGVSHDFQSDWKSYNMTCNSPTTNKVSLVTKPTVKVKLQPTHNVMYQGMICPTKLRVTAMLTSKQAFDGTGVVTVKQSNHQLASHDVNLTPNQTWYLHESFDLKPWNTVNAPVGKAGGSNAFKANPDNDTNKFVSNAGDKPRVPSQRFEVRYILSANQKAVVQTPYKTISVSCRIPSQQVNPNLPTGNHKGLKAPDKEEVKPFKVKPKNLQLKQKAPQQQKLNVIPSKLYQKSRSTGATND